MRAASLLVLASVACAGPASAGARERYAPSDFYPAVSTQYARPDGGRRYEYPPDTGKIVRPEDRSAYDVPPTEAAAKSSRPLPPSAPTDPSKRPPDQVGR